MRIRVLLLACVFLFLAGDTFALGRDYVKFKRSGVTYLRGKKGRKYARRFSLRENLKGDKLAIFDEYGYTPHRLRFSFCGEKTERWKYYSRGLEFWFDDDGNLLETRHFPPETGHID
ncbi:MAG: hypothetical protein GTO51_10975 [Candidatus Latescibacteria bacterium]|nr:hypothetical protein [Candidatus Latescibacterota bacterium]NIM66485.1 hypothetical protein [Candidatus Latescibacterota bacterium]NIO02965.1 hypothetical protein [Candidatus Latescibacterota bacterium]NIO30100.1 hypothetical protein [Candidatus Latescibacterota bacterium]NIO57719.1 hypothetical protein [Candidatus Latescibacterota bacterium]